MAANPASSHKFVGSGVNRAFLTILSSLFSIAPVWADNRPSSAAPKPPETPPTFNFSPALSLTYLEYSQTGFPTFRESAVTAKLNGSWVIAPPNWAIGANVFGTVAKLGSNLPNTDLRMLGANLRVGWLPPNGVFGLESAWRLTLMAGVYYTTTFLPATEVGSFGFKNVAGPQFFPVLHRALKNGGLWSAYFKFSPIADGISFFSLSNYEIAGGLTFRPTAVQVSTIMYTLDVSTLSLQTAGGSSNAFTASLGLGFSL